MHHNITSHHKIIISSNYQFIYNSKVGASFGVEKVKLHGNI